MLRLPLDTAALMDRYFESLLASAAENSVVTTTQAYTDLAPRRVRTMPGGRDARAAERNGMLVKV